MELNEILYTYKMSATTDEELSRDFLIEKLIESNLQPVVSGNTVSVIGIANIKKIILIFSLFSRFENKELYFKAM